MRITMLASSIVVLSIAIGLLIPIWEISIDGTTAQPLFPVSTLVCMMIFTAGAGTLLGFAEGRMKPRFPAVLYPIAVAGMIVLIWWFLLGFVENFEFAAEDPRKQT